MCSGCHFHYRIWTKLENCKRQQLLSASRILKLRRGENKQSYVVKVNETFPTMHHGLYQFATKLLGVDEIAERLAESMNFRARELFPECTIRSSLKMNRRRFWEFFYLQGGKLKEPTTKPHLKDQHIKDRLEFSRHWLKRLQTEKDLYYCFLDEKWFYTTSRCKKEKHLPQADFEDDKTAFIVSRKVKSRRHPCKVMYMGIVGPAIRGLTDGRIMMKRISEWRPLKRETTHQNISPFYELNNCLKLGDWRKLVPADEKIKVSRLLQSIVQEYQIESQISNDLVFTYNDYQISPRAKKIEKKVKYIKRSSKCLVTDSLIHFPSNTNSGDRLDTRNLSVLDLTLCVLLPKNRMVQRDVNCGSSFMISTVDEIGKSIRNAYSFLPQHHPIHLFMDNAGGHGKKEIKEKYHVEKLKRDYNVIVVWQIPHSPETNMLDLGVWMGLQSEVEKYHRKRVMHRDVLARSVEVLFCD